jgi:hypothetical protein
MCGTRWMRANVTLSRKKLRLYWKRVVFSLAICERRWQNAVRRLKDEVFTA